MVKFWKCIVMLMILSKVVDLRYKPTTNFVAKFCHFLIQQGVQKVLPGKAKKLEKISDEDYKEMDEDQKELCMKKQFFTCK